MPEPLLSDERAARSTPLGFLRGQTAQLAWHARARLAGPDVRVAGTRGRWYWRQLEWDSQHFKVPVIRLETADWDAGVDDPATVLSDSLLELLAHLAGTHGAFYVFGEFPAEDCELLQAAGRCGFRLIETRLTYHTERPGDLASGASFPVRMASVADIPHLRDVASRNRNAFDRYHADPFFGPDVADGYLATYAEAAVRGLAQAVLVPDADDGGPPGAFFALETALPPACPLGLGHRCPLGLGIGRIALVAVAPERRGWHHGLLVEASRYLGEIGADVAYMTTQATNRAVIRNCEKVGYRYGRASHVLAMVGRS
jgi:dTDP-4-amino-4,6-dideoxy-D-galactose acyltransferase